jgi:thiol-disulfide isomerase/thioredoxin
MGAALACFLGFDLPAAKIGDPAAPLAIKEWIKGKPVDVKDGKNVYVVEFWATWCGPCRVSIPHLTEVQKKLKDKGVVVVGISDETADKVKPFVETQGEKMDYVVALDDERKTSKAYMQAFNQNGIPHAFIVSKEGKVVWHGHPMDGMDKVLDEIIAGKYDLQAALKKDALREQMDEYRRLSHEDEGKARELGRKTLDAIGNNADALCDFAFAVVTDMAAKKRDFALADEALDQAEKAAGGKSHRALSIRGISRFENGKPDAGMDLVREALKLAQYPADKGRYENYLKIMEQRKASLNAKPGQ